MFNNPCGIAIRNDGIIIVVDQNNHKIKGITPDGIVFTIAGTGEKGDGVGPGNESMFCYPSDVVVMDDDTIIVSDTGNYKIKGIRIKQFSVKSAAEC